MGSLQVCIQVLRELKIVGFFGLCSESCPVSGAVLSSFYPWSQVTLLPRGVGGIIHTLLLGKAVVALVEYMLMEKG